MRKVKKIFLMLIIILLLTNIYSKVFAINPDDYDPSGIPVTKDDAVYIIDKAGVILGAIRNISAVVAVIMIMIIGFNYMLGSVEEKANYKASMLPYIIGCIMAVAGTTLVSFIYNVMN